MNITLYNSLYLTTAYMPYVAAAVATIAVIAAIYFYVRSHSAVSAISTFNNNISTLTSKSTRQDVQRTLDQAITTALQSIATPQELALFTKALIETIPGILATVYANTKPENRQKHITTCIKQVLPTHLQRIWKHPQAQAAALLKICPLEQQDLIKTAGIESLTTLFQTNDLKEKRRIAQELVTLGAVGTWHEDCNRLAIAQLRQQFAQESTVAKKLHILDQLQRLGNNTNDLYPPLVEELMTQKDYTHQLPDDYHEALLLHRDLCQLISLPTVTVQVLAQYVPAQLFLDSLIQDIKQLPGDREKNTRMHQETKSMPAGQKYRSYFSLPPLRESFISLTQKIDHQRENTFDLRNPGEMERIIKVALWFDLLSLSANLGHRDLNIAMSHH